MNSMLSINNKSPSSSQAARIDVTKIDISATPAPKALSLRLIIISRIMEISLLRLNAPTPPKR